MGPRISASSSRLRRSKILRHGKRSVKLKTVSGTNSRARGFGEEESSLRLCSCIARPVRSPPAGPSIQQLLAGHVVRRRRERGEKRNVMGGQPRECCPAFAKILGRTVFFFCKAPSSVKLRPEDFPALAQKLPFLAAGPCKIRPKCPGTRCGFDKQKMAHGDSLGRHQKAPSTGSLNSFRRKKEKKKKFRLAGANKTAFQDLVGVFESDFSRAKGFLSF